MPQRDDELREWQEAIRDVLAVEGEDRARAIIEALQQFLPSTDSTPSRNYLNSISAENQPHFPGDQVLEWKLRCYARWNAMAMVVRANHEVSGIGGHISTYASLATLYEVGFNHFFRGKDHPCGGDIIYFQGHSAPGVYARAFLEGRLTESQLRNFRREKADGGGLSSYPHPRLMPAFWEFPTVSMGLGPLMAIYQARFNRYLEDRGLVPVSDKKVWAFLGDGEMDEPESLGSITLASREKLDNLIFVVNCNLQRLDGPVRGNGKIIQELESAFRGAGWNVIKVIWGGDWDEILAKDQNGLLIKRMNEAVDGEYQKYSVESGAYIREKFFGKYPELLELVSHLSDDQLRKLRRGGHEPDKVYAAYHAAVNHKGQPTVILAKTIKGYGLGESGEGKNVTHQQKKLNDEELKKFRDRFQIPISDTQLSEIPFYRPPSDSPEMQYLLERRKALGGFVPERRVKVSPSMGSRQKSSLVAGMTEIFSEFYEGTKGHAVSTTMVFVKILSKLLRDEKMGKYIVPIVSDEARTFGMESLFRQCGIYAHEGQKYDPVDSKSLLYYREAKDGQILEEGITEAGSLSSLIAGGSAYATHGIATIPFFIFYSMFGFQRVGDLIWAAGDMRCRGFLLGATSGRTTLMGEGLQHQDGHSHLNALAFPSVRAYDPSFAYELAVIIEEGLKDMYERNQDVIYYITLGNQNYEMPPAVGIENIHQQILQGLYRFRKSTKSEKAQVNLFGSGAIMTEVLKAADILESEHGKSVDVWSITSFKALYEGGLSGSSFISDALKDTQGIYVIASDYVKALPMLIGRWFPKTPICLGTDGYGFSESRDKLREVFEVNAEAIVQAALQTN